MVEPPMRSGWGQKIKCKSGNISRDTFGTGGFIAKNDNRSKFPKSSKSLKTTGIPSSTQPNKSPVQPTTPLTVKSPMYSMISSSIHSVGSQTSSMYPSSPQVQPQTGYIQPSPPQVQPQTGYMYPSSPQVQQQTSPMYPVPPQMNQMNQMCTYNICPLCLNKTTN